MSGERVVVVGGGLVGLCAAAALARRGVKVILVAERRAGEASVAAAGMLAPGADGAPGAVHEFNLAARDRFPALVEWVRAETGAEVPLDRGGILHLAAHEGDEGLLVASRRPDARWLSPRELASLEPALSPGACAAGGVLHPLDGWVDNEALVAALLRYVSGASNVTVALDHAVAIKTTKSSATVSCTFGRQYTGSSVVIAGGAWVGELQGLPRALPVSPLRGQIVELRSTPIGHVVFGSDCYLVPRRDGRTLVGSTSERVGFDVGTTAEAGSRLRQAAESLAPALARAERLRHWSGLRPVTPDMLPIIGIDPLQPALIYACGHSRNGILLAPLTGDCVAALACGGAPPMDISPFAVARFAN